MNIDWAWIIIAIVTILAGTALWYILRDNDSWELAGISLDQGDRRKPEGAELRASISDNTRRIMHGSQVNIWEREHNRNGINTQINICSEYTNPSP